MGATELNRTHEGNNSRVAALVISESRFNEFFNGGNTEVVDLRDFF